MKDNVFFLLIFGIVLVGITLFFINFNYISEGFQTTSSSIPTIIESDKFLNERLSPQVVEFKGYSTLFGIKQQFKAYITDWHNFSGNTDRNENVRPTPGWDNKVTYTDFYGNVKEEWISARDIGRSVEFHNSAVVERQKIYIMMFLYSRGQRNGVHGYAFDATNSRAIPTDSVNLRNNNFTLIPGKNFINNFNVFLGEVAKNKLSILRQLLQNLNISDTFTFSNRIDATYYIQKGLYNFAFGTNAVDWRTPHIKVATVDADETISHNIGIFRGNNFILSSLLDKGGEEKLRLNVYGTLCNYHITDFRECLEYGCSFDFKETMLLDMYLNIPFYSKTFNGFDAYYSYGFFFPESKAISSTEYEANNPNILRNKTLTDGVTDTTIIKPLNNNCKINWDSRGNVTGIEWDQGESGFTVPISLSDLPNINDRIIGKITPLMLSKLPNMMSRFIISWCYNRTIRTLDFTLEQMKKRGANNIDKAAHLMELAYNNWSITTGNDKLAWSNYLNLYLYNNVTIVSYENARHGNNYGWYQGSHTGWSRDYNTIVPHINALAHAIYLRDGSRLTANGGTGMPSGVTFRRADNAMFITVSDTSRSGPNNGVEVSPQHANHVYFQVTPAITKPASQTHVNPLLVHKNPDFGNHHWGQGFSDLNDETIGNMKSDFTVLIKKMKADYGIATNIKILDEKFLNSIAQSFYEYSDGLFEMDMIYDVYKIGSNMLDIRFDKKQRLGPISYITLRNRFQPKVREYNNLLELYEQNTWKGLYNNVNDLISNISTIKQELEPVFNPVYTIKNRNPAAIKNEINNLLAINTRLQTQLNSGNTTLTTAITSSNSNVRADYINTLLNSPNSALLDATLLQSKIDLNETKLYDLSNQLDGIETNVARIFYTMTSSSNIIVNGVAVGIHAALSYNTIYNSGLDVDVGSSQGNVNYQPTIIYTKNLIPNLDHTNIDFIKRASQLYMDSIFVTLSNFTSNVYREQEGFIRVDKIFGTKKFDDKTIGFTWQESQYDFYTNEPKKRKINNVILKFAFDNSEYQNPQLYIENQVSNIYLTSNIIDSTYSNSRRDNERLISEYQAKIPILTQEITPLTRTSAVKSVELLPLLSNFITNGRCYYTGFIRRFYHTTRWNPEIPSGYIGRINLVSEDSIKNYYIAKYGNNNLTNLNNLIVTYKEFKNLENSSIRPQEVFEVNSNITNRDNVRSNIDTILRDSYYSDYTFNPRVYNILSYNLNNPTLINLIEASLDEYEYYETSITNRRDQIQEYRNMISNLENINRNLNSNINSNMFNFNKFTNNDDATFTAIDFVKYFNHIENLPIPVESNIKAYIQASNRYNTALSNFNSTITSRNYICNSVPYRSAYLTQQNLVSNLFSNMNSIIRPNLYTNINYSQLNVKLFYELDEIILDNNDGACPDNMVCGNPIIMSQLTDAYNFDSNNTDKITRVFKAFTPNPFRCDYLVEMANSNGVLKKGTIAFEVGQDIEDCSYYITSNFGFNKGYYIIDKVDFVEDNTGTDISGFNYVGNALYNYNDSLVNSISPLITSASNALLKATNAISISRLNTYNVLGRINTMTIKNCPIITYDSLNTLIQKEEFHDSIFRTYPFYSNHMSRIISAGIFTSNMFDITYNSLELGYSSNTNISIISEKLQGARYMVSTSKDFCDFYPVFMCNVPAIPSKEALKLTNIPTTSYYNSNVTSNLNIINSSNYSCKYLNINSLKILDLIIRNYYTRGNTITSETIREQNTNNIYILARARNTKLLDKIKSYLRVDVDKVIFDISYRVVNTSNVRYNSLVEYRPELWLYEFNKDNYNQPIIKNRKLITTEEFSYYKNIFGSNKPYTIPHGYNTSNQFSNIGGIRVNTEILRNIDVNPLVPSRPTNTPLPTQENTIQYIKECIGVKTIHDYIWDNPPVLSFNNTVLPSKINILNTFQTEIIILSNVNEMPIHRTNLLVRGYYVANSNYYTIEIFDIIPVNFPSVPTLFMNRNTNFDNMGLINSFRNLYNSRNKNTSNYSELSKVYVLNVYTHNGIRTNICDYGASVYYKYSSNTYNFNILPNDIKYNSLKYFRITYYNLLNKKIQAVDYQELGIFPPYRPHVDFQLVNDTNPIEQSNFNYFMSNLKFRSFNYEIEVQPSATGEQICELAHIEFYYNGIFKHNIRNLTNYFTFNDYVDDYELVNSPELYIYDYSTNTWLDNNGMPVNRNRYYQVNYDYLTNSQNVNISADNEPQTFKFSNNVNFYFNLSDSISISGYSIVFGNNRNSYLKTWKLYAYGGGRYSTDDSPIYFEVHSVTNYSNTSPYPFGLYYRTPIFSFGGSNIPLVQYPFYEKSMEECGISIITSNIIDFTLNKFPFNIFDNKLVDIKNLLSYYYDGRWIYLAANIFPIEEIPPPIETLTTVAIKVRVKNKENCSQILTLDEILHNITIQRMDYDEPTYIYNNISIPSTYTSLSNYSYISNMLYEHARKGKYAQCSNNPIRTDSIEPLFALFERIYFYGTPESEQVLLDDFTFTAEGGLPPFIGNPVSNDLESLNILYSKIVPNQNLIIYILSVNTYDITSGYVTIEGYNEWQDRIVSPTPITRRFVYNITSPYFTDCTNITYIPKFNKVQTRILNRQGLTSYASSNRFLPYSSSNTFTNIKLLHLAFEFKALSDYFPAPQAVINEVYNNGSLNSIFNVNSARFDSRFGFPYYKIDVENFTYDIIINNISTKKIYKYEDLDNEGTIYYTDTIPFNYIWNLYELSNIRTYINHSDVQYTNSSNIYNIRIKLDDMTIQQLYLRLKRREFEYVTAANVQRITNLTNVNLTNYITTNNFISNSNYEIYNFSYGDTDTASIFNSNSYSLDFVKSNCRIEFINPSIINKFATLGRGDDGYEIVLWQFSQDIYDTIYSNIRIDRGEGERYVDIDPGIFPIIEYGKENSVDALRYNYILKWYDTANEAFYTEFSIKFYYGNNLNRIYRPGRKVYLTNPDNLCLYNYTISLVNVLTSEELPEYVAENQYESLFKYSVEYQNLILQVTRCPPQFVDPLSPNFMNAIFGENGFSPIPRNINRDEFEPFYTKLVYVKNNIEELMNKYVFSIYTLNNMRTPYYLEYSLNINSFTTCRNFTVVPTYYRSLNYNNMLLLSNDNYIPYFDGIDIERNLSNCGVNYNSILSNDMFFGPLSVTTRTNIETSLSIEINGALNILYKRYQSKLGIVDYSYLIQMNNDTIIEYGIYFLYAPSSNCSQDAISNYYYINSLTGNTADYASENNYVSVTPIVTLTNSQKMSLYGLNSVNTTLINFMNSNLSNLGNNPLYTNNLLTINYTKTNYTNLTNSYIVAYWPPTTTLTLDSLVNTAPNYLQYNITLSNIQSSSNYVMLSSIPTPSTGPPEDFTLYLNNVFYKQRTRYTTNFYEIAYTPSNCYPTYTASNLINRIVNHQGIQSILTSPPLTVDLSTENIRGVVAYKNNNSTRTFDYIVEILKETVFYYPAIRVSLGTPTILENCSSYINDDEIFIVPTHISNISYNNLSNYINSNGYTTNISFTTQAPEPSTGTDPSTGADTTTGAEADNPEEFRNYTQLERKKQVYSIILFQSENSFKISNFKLYTFNDVEIPVNIIQQNNISIYFQNTKNFQIKGYSFITNSVSSEYDPKSWAIKGTNDGRKWTELDSKSIRDNISRNYQLPIIYFNGKTKPLPQPVSKSVDKPKVEKIDKETLIKYYKQKINHSIKPDYKKYMRDNDTYYFLYDEYDLNRNLVGTDLIIGFIIKNGNVKKPIMYEDDEGNYLPFDLKNPKIKHYWDKKVMLSLLFQDF